MSKDRVREVVLSDLRDQWQMAGTDDELLAQGMNDFDLGAEHFVEGWAERFFGWPARTFDIKTLYKANTFGELVDVIADRWDGTLHAESDPMDDDDEGETLG